MKGQKDSRRACLSFTSNDLLPSFSLRIHTLVLSLNVRRVLERDRQRWRVILSCCGTGLQDGEVNKEEWERAGLTQCLNELYRTYTCSEKKTEWKMSISSTLLSTSGRTRPSRMTLLSWHRRLRSAGPMDGGGRAEDRAEESLTENRN